MRFLDYGCTVCGRGWLSHQLVRELCPRCGGPCEILTDDNNTTKSPTESDDLWVGCVILYAAAGALIALAGFLYSC